MEAASSIAVSPDGTVYVSTDAMDGIRKFSPEGRPEGNIRLRRMVIDLAAAPDGSLYALVDGGVRHFSADGRLIDSWRGFTRRRDRQFVVASGIAVAADGSIYISGAGVASVIKLNPRGRVQRVWGGRGVDGKGRGRGEFSYPSAIAVGSGGRVHVADESNYRVQSFRPNGAFKRKWMRFGWKPGQAVTISDLATGPGGTVYVSDEFLGRIQVFGGRGRVREQWGGLGENPGRFRDLSDLATGPSNTIFTLEADGRVQRFEVDQGPAEPRPALSFSSLGEGYARPGATKKYRLEVLNYGDAAARNVRVCPPDEGPVAELFAGGTTCREIASIPGQSRRRVNFSLKAPDRPGTEFEFEFDLRTANAGGGTLDDYLWVLSGR